MRYHLEATPGQAVDVLDTCSLPACSLLSVNCTSVALLMNEWGPANLPEGLDLQFWLQTKPLQRKTSLSFRRVRTPSLLKSFLCL